MILVDIRLIFFCKGVEMWKYFRILNTAVVVTEDDELERLGAYVDKNGLTCSSLDRLNGGEEAFSFQKFCEDFCITSEDLDESIKHKCVNVGD